MVYRFSRLIKVCVLLVWSGAAQSAELPILINVDISDVFNLEIRSTGAFAAVDDSSTDTFYGIILEGYYQSEFAIPGVIVSSDLSPSGTAQMYDSVFQFPTAMDLNIYLDKNSIPTLNDTQIFSTSLPAFTGSLFMDLSYKQQG